MRVPVHPLVWLIAPLLLAAAVAAAEPRPLRAVKLGARPAEPAAREMVDWARDVGFDTLWVPSGAAGQWTALAAPDGPALDPAFLDLAARCRADGTRLLLALEPFADSAGTFVFTDRDALQRLATFARAAARRAGVRAFVISFRDADPQLLELADLLELGRNAAPAHAALAARVSKAVGRSSRVWIGPPADRDPRTGGPHEAYRQRLAEEIADLPDRVGVVWRGGGEPAPLVSAEALAAEQALFAGRSMLFEDLFPGQDTRDGRIPIAAVLSALDGRDPALALDFAGYVATPGHDAAASRLSLRTVAEWLRDPQGYEPQNALATAAAAMVGAEPDADALDALRTQAIEWGGAIDGPNWRPASSENPESAALSLLDPARVQSWSWVVRRYPERIEALEGLGDAPFRDALVAVMGRRLAIARAVPVVRELLARRAAGRRDVQALVAQLERQRDSLAARPDARLALDRFLVHAGAAISPRSSLPREADPTAENPRLGPETP